ncbi:hypothetical protein MRX96_012210 [Rhipicephalus microplus]
MPVKSHQRRYTGGSARESTRTHRHTHPPTSELSEWRDWNVRARHTAMSQSVGRLVDVFAVQTSKQALSSARLYGCIQPKQWKPRALSVPYVTPGTCAGQRMRAVHRALPRLVSCPSALRIRVSRERVVVRSLRRVRRRLDRMRSGGESL